MLEELCRAGDAKDNVVDREVLLGASSRQGRERGRRRDEGGIMGIRAGERMMRATIGVEMEMVPATGGSVGEYKGEPGGGGDGEGEDEQQGGGDPTLSPSTAAIARRRSGGRDC